MNLNGVDKETQQREVIDRAIMRVNTCLPGQIVSFDADTQTVTVKPAITMRTVIDGTESFVALPEIINAPILFPFVSVAGFALTFPVRAGDPCLIVFSQRSIDNWHERGGIQPPEDGAGSRHHDLTDAFVMFAPSPLPEVLDEWESAGIELRNRNKDSRITLRDEEVEIQTGDTKTVVNSDGEIQMTAPVKYTVTCPTSEYSGTITATGKIKSNANIEDPKGTMQGMRDTYNIHTHPDDGASPPTQQMV